MARNKNRQFFIALTGTLALGLASGAHAAPFSAIYGFGDTLVDTGNVFAGTGGTIPASPPYFQGRFSNGPIALEVFAAAFGLPANASLLGGTNFAIGAARTGSGGIVPGVLDQVGLLGTQTGGSVDSKALYFIFAGGNDLRDAAANPGNAALIAQQAAANLATALDLLYGMGARSFLVPNLPNIGRLPEAIASGNAVPAALLTIFFNQLLAGQLTAFQLTHPGAQVIRFDAFLFLEGLIQNAGVLGFTNTTAPCLTTVGCNPAQFVFWDDIHPTAAVHALFGNALVTAVPEPSALVLVALGAAATRMFRRRK